jgi:catechol 2,3-dioxygenase-like lactoylglutathione lyase family enzyme
MHFLDPVGRSMRVLHLFRRNPTLSITLGVASIDTSRRLYQGVLGMRELSTEELVGLYLPLPPPPPLRRLALTLGDPHSTTSVVLEEVSPQAAAGRRESDDKAPLLGFEVQAESLAGLHEAVALAGLEVSPFDAAEHRSFAVQDEDGYVLHVVARV